MKLFLNPKQICRNFSISSGSWVFGVFLFNLFLFNTSIKANDLVSFEGNETLTVQEIFDKLQKENNYILFYSADDIDLSQKVYIGLENVNLEQILESVCKVTNLKFEIEGNNIFIKPLEKKNAKENIEMLQDLAIRGKIKDSSREPLIGATITVKGTSKGTITDYDGNFVLNLAPSELPVTLVISSVGYLTEEIDVTSPQEELEIVLVEDIISLDEVIVVAYGVAKKESFTGSATSIKGSVVSSVPVVEFNQALEGKVAGLSTGIISGQPGSGVNIRIRGTGSILASKEPLYVIDGVPVVNANMGGASTLPGNIMSTLNPSDIESISVLKDAAAASLYGSRAANGVIIVTTKKGKAGKTAISFKAEYGSSDWAVSLPEHLDGDREREMKREGLINYYMDAGWTEEEAIAHVDNTTNDETSNPRLVDIAPIPEQGYSDWESELFRNGVTKNYEVNARGGNEKTTFFTSLSYFDQTGVMEESNFNRYTGKINLNHTANKFLSLGFNTLLSATEQNGVTDRTTYYTNPYLGVELWLGPTVAMYNSDGSYNTDIYSTFPNLLHEFSLDNINRTNSYRSFSTAYAELNLAEDLKFKSTLGVDLIFTDFTGYDTPESRNGRSTNGSGSKNHRIWKMITSSNILSYQKSIGDHNFDAIAGFEMETRRDELSSISAEDYAAGELYVISTASDITGASNYYSEGKMNSYISRLNYNYQDKYYLSGSMRWDANSTLAPKTRWGNFWSVSGSWRITEEDFIAFPSWLNDWKVRASYGTSGTLPGGYYAYQGLYTYSGYDYNGEGGAAPSSLQNDNLTWEQNYNTNIGTDIRLFNRFSIEFEYYYRVAKDMLLSVPLSRVTGMSSQTLNYGEMENKGIELKLSSDNIRTNNFNWNTTFILGTVRNKILKLYNGEDLSGDYNTLQREGEAYGSFYLREYAGVNPENGNAQWYINETDEEGNIINHDITEDYTEANLTIVGDPFPDFEGSFLNTFTWKGVSLSLNFSYKSGGETYDYMGALVERDGARYYSPIRANQWDRWQNPGDQTDIPRQVYGNSSSVASSRYIHDADFIRLKNTTLSYNLPSQWVKKVKMENARIYFNGVNLWTWSKYDVYDPEVGSDGIYFVTLPPLKTFTFGIEIGF